MTRFEKRKQTMIENIMRDEKVSFDEAERIFYDRLSQAGRKGGKSHKKTPSGFAANPERAREASLKGLAKRWGHGKNPEV